MKTLLCIAIFSLFALGSVEAQSMGTVLTTELGALRLAPLNALYFIAPPMIFNIIFGPKLKLDHFPGAAPKPWEAVEWVFRVASFMYPLFLPINPENPGFGPGLTLYCLSMALYFASWLPYMASEEPSWARNWVFRFAPAYLPILWLGGISLMSNSTIHAGLSIVFVSFHVGEYVIRYGKREGSKTSE